MDRVPFRKTVMLGAVILFLVCATLANLRLVDTSDGYLYSGGVTPSSGSAGDAYTFYVYSTESYTVYVVIDNTSYTMTYDMYASQYKYNASSLSTGSHAYYFYYYYYDAYSNYQEERLPSSGYYYGPSVVSGLTNGDVSPSSGDADTLFTFSVQSDYYDTYLYLDGDGYSMSYSNLTGYYSYQTYLSSGAHYHYFYYEEYDAYQGWITCRLPETGYFWAPNVTSDSDSGDAVFQVGDTGVTVSYQGSGTIYVTSASDPSNSEPPSGYYSGNTRDYLAISYLGTIDYVDVYITIPEEQLENVNESTVELYWWDSYSYRWVKVGSSYNENTNTLYARLTQGGVYTWFAEEETGISSIFENELCIVAIVFVIFSIIAITAITKRTSKKSTAKEKPKAPVSGQQPPKPRPQQAMGPYYGPPAPPPFGTQAPLPPPPPEPEEPEERYLSPEDVLESSIELTMPQHLESGSTAEILVRIVNRNDAPITDLILDLSDVEGFFEIEGQVRLPTVRRGMDIEQRIKMRPKFSKGTFPVTIIIQGNDTSVEKNYIIKVGGTEVY